MPDEAGLGMAISAFVLRLDQIGPRSRHRQPFGCQLHRVGAEGREPGVDADPVGRVSRVAELGANALQAGRRIGFQHALLVGNEQAGGRQAPHDIGLRIVFLGQQFGGDNAGRVAHDVDFDIRVSAR